MCLRRLLPALAVVLAACDDPDPAPTETTPAAGHMSAAIDGVPWRADLDAARTVGRFPQPGVLELTGIDLDGATGRQITIEVRGFTGLGIYILSLPGEGSSASYVASTGVRYTTIATAGILRVSTWDPGTRAISGTFNFIAARVGVAGEFVNVSAGTYEGRLQQQ